MSFEVEVVVELQYVRVTPKGEYTVSDIFPFLDQVKIEAVNSNRNKVLIDTSDFTAPMTDVDRFTAGKRFAEVFGVRFKLATLLPEHNITKMGELAAVNRGARVLVTSSETEALEWLLD